MSYMFELYYKPPTNSEKEAAVTRQVASLGGHLDYREEPNGNGQGGICLTFEFEDLAAARQAAEVLRKQGEHIEGPMDYGA